MSYSLAFTQSIAVMICVGGRNELLGVTWVSAAYLSRTLGIPRSTVASILARLVAAGLLESREGKNGGVRLTQPARSLTLLDIFDAVERKRPLFPADLPADPEWKEIMGAGRRVLESFAAAEKAVRNTLAGVPIDSLFRAGRAPRPTPPGRRARHPGAIPPPIASQCPSPHRRTEMEKPK